MFKKTFTIYVSYIVKWAFGTDHINHTHLEREVKEQDRQGHRAHRGPLGHRGLQGQKGRKAIAEVKALLALKEILAYKALRAFLEGKEYRAILVQLAHEVGMEIEGPKEQKAIKVIVV